MAENKIEKLLWEGKIKLVAVITKKEGTLSFNTEEFDVGNLIDIILNLDEKWRYSLLLAIIGELERIKYELLNAFSGVRE